MDSKVYEMQAEYFKALSHPVRIRIINFLRKGEKCVCDIVPYLKEEQSNVSRHLATLKRAGILSSEKRGVSVYYQIKDKNVYRVLDLVLDSLKKITREKADILS